MPLLLACAALNVIGLAVFIRYARRQALLDTPNARSSHTVPTVRGGGLLFAPTFIALLLYLQPGAYWPALALLLAAVVSFWDDLRGLSVRARLPVHLLSAALLIYSAQAAWPPWAWLLALVLLTGWLNTSNFMDGINGITGLYGLVFLCSIWLAKGGQQPSVELGMMAALAAFLFFNFRKRALCFAGDIGSVSLALILAWAFLTAWQGPASLYLLAFPALYAVDSVMTIIVRLSKGENIFQAHRSHLYQLLANERQWDHRLVAALYASLQLGINLLALNGISGLPARLQFQALLALYLVLCGCYFLLRRLVLARSANEGVVR